MNENFNCNSNSNYIVLSKCEIWKDRPYENMNINKPWKDYLLVLTPLFGSWKLRREEAILLTFFIPKTHYEDGF